MQYWGVGLECVREVLETGFWDENGGQISIFECFKIVWFVSELLIWGKVILCAENG
jgi:hypothetical protein